MSNEQLNLIPDAAQPVEAPQPPEQAPAEAPAETSRERIERLTREAMGAEPPTEPGLKAVDEHGYTREVDTGRFAEPEDEAAEVPEEGAETPEEEVQVEEALDTEAEETFEVELPPRDEGQDPLKISVSTRQEADHLRMLTNGFMRRQEFNRQMDQVRTDQVELQTIEEDLRADPAGFVLSKTPRELQSQLALSILTTMPDEQLNGVIDQLAQWERNPQVRELAAAQLETERLRAQMQQQQKQQARSAANAQATAIQNAIVDLVPDSYPQDKADRFYRTAMFSLREYLRSNQLREFPPEEVRPFLESNGILTDYGITERAVPSQPNGRQGTQIGNATTPKRTEQRKAAASVAPAGAGAGAAGGEAPPKGQTLRERMQWYREKIGH